MSVCSTPRYSSSSAASSPMAQDRSILALNLTPRSKVRALLASIEDDSGSEDQSIDSHVLQHSSRPKSCNFALNSNYKNHSDDENSRTENLSRHGDRPVFNLQTARKVGSDKERESDASLNAYQRVKQHLLGSNQVEEGRLSHIDRSSPDPSSTPPFGRMQSADVEIPAQLPGLSRGSSPGLFISTTLEQSQSYAGAIDSGSEILPSIKNPSRLTALVERRRQAQSGNGEVLRSLADQNESFETAPQRIERHHCTFADAAEAEDDMGNEEAERKFTQQARPTRKASKKALQEIHRETQRIDRNRQLTHEARTKVKYTTESLFARFKFGQNRQPAPSLSTGHYSSSSIEAFNSDVDTSHRHETPPSSPPSSASEEREVVGGTLPAAKSLCVDHSLDADGSSNDVNDIIAILAKRRQERGRKSASAVPHISAPVAQRISMKWSPKTTKQPSRGAVESDDDLEIIPPAKTRAFAAFENPQTIAPRDTHPLRALRALAQVTDRENSRGKVHNSLRPLERDRLLKVRAREQARCEREEKLQRLKEKGIIVISAQEKEREQLQIENMIEKARQEAHELSKREKVAAKKQGTNIIDDDQHLDSDRSDAEWLGVDGSEAGDIQFSGSEEEEEEEEEDERDSEDETSSSKADYKSEENEDDPRSDEELEAASRQSEHPSNNIPFVADTAVGNNDEDKSFGDVFKNDSRLVAANVLPKRSMHHRKIIESDDEEDVNQVTTSDMTPSSRRTTISMAFGFSQKKSAAPTLSQVFAGTMADSPPDALDSRRAPPSTSDLTNIFANTMASEVSQTPSDTLPIDSQPFSIAFLRTLPLPTTLSRDDSFTENFPTSGVKDSQGNNRTGRESQQHGLVRFDTQPTASQSQASQMPDPSQDVGFRAEPVVATPEIVAQHDPTPYGSLTTMSPPLIEANSTPIAKRPRRLVRAAEVIYVSDSETTITPLDEVPRAVQKPHDAFEIMLNGAKQPTLVEKFDKSRSAAKSMVEEQAEESEDEYAGLGGESDDESRGDLDEEMHKLINDDGKEKVNQAEIAALYADKARAEDEKQVERLYRDIANGGLRRKRGAELDLFDSDDEDEAAARKRAARQRENARLRKALLTDEKLGKIAQNPKQQAFLAAIEDRGDQDENNILDHTDTLFAQYTASHLESGSQAEQHVPDQMLQSPIASQFVIDPLHTDSSRKRAHAEFVDGDNPCDEDLRPGSNLRRASYRRTVTRPTTLTQVRSILTEYIGETNSIAGVDADEHGLASPDYDELLGDPGHNMEEDCLSNSVDNADQMLPSRSDSQTIAVNPRRTNPTEPRRTVIDRMALKRGTSSSTSLAATSANTSAWTLPSNASFSSFRKPSLLRRATFNVSSTGVKGDADSAATARGAMSTATDIDRVGGKLDTSVGMGTGKETVKKGGSVGRSSVNWYRREEERQVRIARVMDRTTTKSRALQGSIDAAAMRRDLLSRSN